VNANFIQESAVMKILAVMLMANLLAGCSGGDEPVPAQKGTVSEDNVFKPQVDALNKAKGVEQLIQDSAEQQRQDVEAIEE
jgi:hypothetical protein